MSKALEVSKPSWYQNLFDNVLVKMDAEKAHHLGIKALAAVSKSPAAVEQLRRAWDQPHPELVTTHFGRSLSSPVGLAAGLDKNAQAIDALDACGFGFVEVGTITGEEQPGNEKPRLFRLPADKAIINRMGFNNDGSFLVTERLIKREERGTGRAVLGINIGKTKIVPAEEAIADYVKSTLRLAPLADYMVVNVSSPNTPGLRDLQAVESLEPLLKAVQVTANRVTSGEVPLLVKIAPDLADEDVVSVAKMVDRLGIQGVIATNTTISRDGLTSSPSHVDACGAGGLSGPILRERSCEVLTLLRQNLRADTMIISVGGISDSEDAWQRICAGANLLQVYTGFIYGGPAWLARINAELAQKVRAAGYLTIAEAVGSGLATTSVDTATRKAAK